MKLSEFVGVRTNYTRSVNIERDSLGSAVERTYVITTRARQTLERIVQAARSSESARAWALVGPYGAGKSAFGLFLNNLLADPTSERSKTARRALRQADSSLATHYESLVRNTRGFCSILLTGSPEPLGRRIVQAMLVAAARFFAGSGRPPRILEDLRAAQHQSAPSASEILELITNLQEAIYRRKGRGVLLVIDELGKFLEYEARHRGASDIYLLQALAEHSVRLAHVPVVLMVLLHQSFEVYAQRFGEQLRNEWKKISGRFESVPFLESAEQTIRLIQVAITADMPAPILRRVQAQVKQCAVGLKEAAALPNSLTTVEAQRLFAACYPLHPASLLILPTLCQRVAQNERTLFSYLGSHEPHGFLQSLDRLSILEASPLPWIRPADIYEYFILNQPGLAVDHGTHRRWAEVVTALERIGDVPALEVELIKTIGLLNVIGAQAGLKASDQILALTFDNEQLTSGALPAALDHLQKKSTITFRRFSGEYRVWQGSDFDIEAAVVQQRSQSARVDIAEVLNEKSLLPPVVARRHAISSGTLRYFTPIFVSIHSIGELYQRSSPTMYVCVIETPTDIDVFRERLRRLGGSHCVGAIYEDGALLREAVLEVQALERIQHQSQDLVGDPVGQRELRDRLLAALRLEIELVTAIIDEPEVFEWFWDGKQSKVKNKRELQRQLSDILDKVYRLAPILKNELINRDRPSSNAIAGRKKLLLAMLLNPQEKDLGTEKFPPEKAMYRAILRATGLHAPNSGEWRFQAPGEGTADTANMAPVWQEVMRLLSDGESIPVTSIYATLRREPYGIKEGVLPILLLAIYQALNKELALCESDQFVPFLTQEVLEGLLKRPEAYSLQRVQFDSLQRALYVSYAEILGLERGETQSLVKLLQPLAKMMMSLPEYTRTTRRFSAEALAVRDLFFAAKTPVQLVFTDLPNALGVVFEPAGNTAEQVAKFAEKLKSALTELRVAYHSLLNEFAENLRTAFALAKALQLHEIRDTLRGRCHGLQAFTIDEQGLKAFIGRIVDPFGDETHWLINVATFLARKPPEKWTDDDLQAAQFRLRELVSRIIDLRQLQLHYERGRQVAGQDFEAALLRIISTETGEAQALVSLDQHTRQVAASRITELRSILDRLPSQETKLAALASLLGSLLGQTKDTAEEIHSPNGRVA